MLSYICHIQMRTISKKKKKYFDDLMKDHSGNITEVTPQCVAFTQCFSIALQVFSSRQISLFPLNWHINHDKEGLWTETSYLKSRTPIQGHTKCHFVPSSPLRDDNRCLRT